MNKLHYRTPNMSLSLPDGETDTRSNGGNRLFRFRSVNRECLSAQGMLRPRKATVLIYIGRDRAISRNAFLLGLSLILLNIADALLTHAGISLLGVEFEGNFALRELMVRLDSAALALFFTKSIAVGFIVWLTIAAHTERWVRPLLGIASGVFIAFAIIPWSVILLSHAL
ncbi:MAG: hypothetical protein KDD70_16160 [Bdellovibrionales bacterium]|nr:hypothetical protein [Bdellovibrionales bacterium]